ncbi:BatD family protein [Aurantimonas sp. DM33-3]|uniref:BatD family protein n=1 Tax=Aurantimonas sp. DM33-3 TaxID=2766955 RepID=UPI001651CF50|nr:BatD family protein [Aurantimonas sp. DM33-3]MBC6718332.1 BatD family protein [Aurantimonas sp. DM33-3]
MVGRLLFTLSLFLFAAAGPAEAAPEISARDARLAVVVDAMPADPYEDEMVLVTIRGLYDVTIALETLVQPDLRNFSWMQLGRDSWTTQRIDGRQLTVFERRLAIFPERGGDLTVGAFTHRLTLVANNGERFVHNVVSEPVTIAAVTRPATEGGWWLPARSLSYSDEWDMDPAMLANGETATRKVTIVAEGVPPGSLPPPPRMIAPWLISFIAPERRSVELTENGPVSTVVWQWRMRPVSSQPGRLGAFHIPWFDTTTREMRDAVLKSQRIAFAAIAEEPEASGWSGLIARNAPLLAGLGSCFLVLLLALPGRRLVSPAEIGGRLRRFLPDRNAVALRRAAARNDAKAARTAAAGLSGSRGELPAAARTAFARLDRHLYGPQPSPPLDLKGFARQIFLAQRLRRRRG